MILYLKDGTEPEKPLLRKHVCENDVADQFRLRYDSESDDPYLVRKWDDGEAPFLQFQYRADFLEHMHTKSEPIVQLNRAHYTYCMG